MSDEDGVEIRLVAPLRGVEPAEDEQRSVRIGPISERDLLALAFSGHRGVESLLSAAMMAACHAPPRKTRKDWPEALALGDRARIAAGIYERTFGPQIETVATCSACNEKAAMAVPLSLFRAQPVPKSQTVVLRGECLSFRLPTLSDLRRAAAHAEADVAGAIALCCLDGDQAVPEDLEQAELASFGEAVSAFDPCTDIVLDAACPACDVALEVSFDVADSLDQRLRAEARRLLALIDRLASAYGWTEAEILAVPPRRRQAYLEFLAA